MIINKTIEVADGSVTFQGELTGQELDVVLQYGLNYLMAMGAIKSSVINEETISEGTDTLQ